MQDTFARTRTRPEGYAAARPSARATIGYLVFKNYTYFIGLKSFPNELCAYNHSSQPRACAKLVKLYLSCFVFYY